MQLTFTVSNPRRTVLFSSAAIFLVWVAVHIKELTSSQNGFIRFVLTAFFAALILFRPKPYADRSGAAARREETGGAGDETTLFDAVVAVALASAFTGIMLVIWGLVFNIRQFEWLGMLLMLGGCLRWSLPRDYGRDILLSLFLLYWAHPLPSQIFGPLQFFMQRMSVRGTEWLLQGFNVRVWADGMVLRTAFSIYEIPSWCSGMRTATTVFLLSLGLGFLRRLRWLEIVLLVAAALFQALVLNILRISTMILAARAMGLDSGVDFLHDTAGIIVLLAVLLVYVEILLLGRFKKKLSRLKHVTIESPTEHPPVWRYVGTFKWVAIFGIFLAVILAAPVLRNSAGHRLRTMRDVALMARDSDNLEQAEITARAALEETPDDVAWRLSTLRIMLMREKYEEVLHALDGIPETDAEWANEKKVLKSYALMALGDVREAAEIVQTLPAGIRANNPRVSMVLAEMGFQGDQPAKVADNIKVAAQWPPNQNRVRKLYPYLRYHRKWESISESDSRAPFVQPDQALSALEAYMNLDRAGEIGTTLLAAIERWPDDPRLLEPLFYMTIKRVGTVWEDRFAAHLRRSVHFVDDLLYLHGLLEKCFELGRPDLAWRVHYRMEEIGPGHPLLYMNVVKYGDRWMAFRRRFLGLPAAAADERIDFRLYYAFGKSLARWRPLCEQIPYGEDISRLGASEIRSRYLQKSLTLFRELKARDELSVEMQYEYVRALDMADRVEEARQALAGIPALSESDREHNRGILSEIYERREDWAAVYEALRGCLDSERPELSSLLRFCEAQLELRLGLMALHSAAETVRFFPHSGQAAAMLAEVMLAHDSPEQALFELSRPDYRSHPEAELAEAQTLHKTERFTECENFCKTRMLPKPKGTFSYTQHLRLPPAEIAVLWHHVFVPSEASLASYTEALRKKGDQSGCAFLRDLSAIWIECYDAGGQGNAADPAGWAACGRDRFEKGAALGQLVLLLCRAGRSEAAHEAARQAVEWFPESHILRRFLISLSQADPLVIDAARRACPRDPEIWLAELVLKTSRVAEQPPQWNEEDVLRELRSLLEAPMPVFPPAAMSRAAEYLMRKGMTVAAALAARDATGRARGLLPVYVTGIRCAIRENDREWALQCTKRAILAARRPIPAFYEKMVALKTVNGVLQSDADVVDALKRLRQADPRDPLWAEMLGYVRFERGGWEITEAVSHMIDAISAGSTNRIAYLVGGLASETLGNIDRAAEMLGQGAEQYPSDIEIMNNYVYVLASSPDGLPRAQGLLPALLAAAGDDLHVLDTASVVLMRAGRSEEAERMAARIRMESEAGSHLWFRAGLHQAQILYDRGNMPEALAALRSILDKTREIPDEDVLAAGKLQESVSEALKQNATTP